jgi:hypothetical protein
MGGLKGVGPLGGLRDDRVILRLTVPGLATTVAGIWMEVDGQVADDASDPGANDV